MRLKIAGGLLFVLVAMLTVTAMPVNAAINSFLDVTLNGGYVVSEAGGATDSTFTDTMLVSMPSGASVEHAYLYLSFATPSAGDWSVDLAGNDLGDPYDALIEIFEYWGTSRYDVGSIVTGSGSYSLTVSALDAWGVFFGATLLVIYSQPTAPLIRIMVQDGAQSVINTPPPKDLSPYTVSFTGISTAYATSATLTVMANSGNEDGTGTIPEDDQLRVNGVVIDEDAFHGDDGYVWDVNSWNVYSLLASSVDVDFDEFSGIDGMGWNGYVVDLVILAVTYPIPVHVDIKPSSWPNQLNLKDKGVLPVAIYGTEDFDVTTVDPASVELTIGGFGVPPLRWSYKDVNYDGYLDLTFKFKTQEVIATLGLDALHDGDVVTLILIGNLKPEFSGTPIQGQDVVWIIEK